MNNTQFRRLVLDTPSAPRQNGEKSKLGAATPSALGSRMRSSMPMTPRSVAGSQTNDFALQLAERNAEINGEAHGSKRFRSSAAPKGTRLASGYQDRTHLRTSTEDDDKASRVKALEDMVKLGQMDRATFEALRDEIIGGDVRNVHLVKGLDFKLLERVKRGEDVLADKAVPELTPSKATQEEETTPETAVDVDEELDELENKEIQPVIREEKVKKGEMGPPALFTQMAGRKRTRDDILKELKASRASIKREPALSAKFKKVGVKKEESRIERDASGREVLITVDANGKVKRKVRKGKSHEDDDSGKQLLMPDKDVAPLGSDVASVVVSAPVVMEEPDDGDIFEGMGADFDPLGINNNDNEDDDENDTDTDDDDDDDDEKKKKKNVQTMKDDGRPLSEMPPPPPPIPIPLSDSQSKRNYFNEPNNSKSTDNISTTPIFSDPSILSAVKKAASLSASAKQENDDDGAERRARLLASSGYDRDAEDMDLGFGNSRFGDAEEEEDGKLSVWDGPGPGPADGDADEDTGKRKRKGKGDEKEKKGKGGKRGRKGDGNKMSDVMAVLDRRGKVGI